MTGYDERYECAAAWAIKLDDMPLSRTDQASFQRWLDSDPHNTDALAEIIGAWQAVEHYATAAPMMDLREEALANARQAGAAPIRESRARKFAAMLVAACLGVILIGVTGWYLQQPEIYSTGQGETRVVVLDDASRLSLDAGTTVKVRYSSRARQLWLEKGRAKFTVSKDPLRPFSVASGGKLVVATGTEFSVERLRGQTRVILYEGQVAILGSGTEVAETNELIADRRSAKLDFLTMDAGTELIVTKTSGSNTPKQQLITRDPAVLDETSDWEAGKLVFDDETLAVVAQRVNRYSDRPIRLGDGRVGQLRISGVFRAGDTESLVEALNTIFGVTSHDDGKSIVLENSKAPVK